MFLTHLREFGHDHLMRHKDVHMIRLRENSFLQWSLNSPFVNSVGFKDLSSLKKNLGPNPAALKMSNRNWKWLCICDGKKG